MSNGDSITTTPLAIWSVGLSAFGGCCCLTSIGGIVCGHIARKRIKDSGGTLQGSGVALTGLILGYVILILVVLAIIAQVTLGIFGATQQPTF